ncbi:hypothetical protein ACFQ4X_07000 [Fictibacillus halophilus]|uniref:hypothetical protein n=1 Tax=Fictibacillus halophilus TaxID=1610490 RepID=UPI0036294B04
MMNVKLINEFFIQKYGNEITEYEDAFAYKDDENFLHIAISDGSTEASFSKEWAQILVNHYVKSPTTLINMKWLRPAIKELYNIIKIDSLPWYAKNKFIEQGSYATLIGLSFNKQENQLSIVAVGDSCALFEYVTDKLLIPFDDETKFSNNPYLISSLENRNELLINNQFTAKLEIDEELDIFCMSDALGSWYYSSLGCLGELEFLESNNDFIDFVSDNRKNNTLKNDDVTLIHIKVSFP